MQYKLASFLVALSITISSHILSITHKDAERIGMQIWKNEGNQQEKYLVFWSEHEPFPSFGIGHCIWYPANLHSNFTQEFPQLCNYLQKHGVSLPLWLKKAKNKGAPWKSRDEFLKDSKRTAELQKLLSSTIELQTTFMIDKLEHRWPLMLQAAPAKQRKKLLRSFALMKSSLLGTYALVDYLNFKGSGLNKAEESKGQRWGLLQVLLALPNNVSESTINREFALSAQKILSQRVKNAAPEEHLAQFLAGWINRTNTYANSELFTKH